MISWLYGFLGFSGISLLVWGVYSILKWGRALEKAERADKEIKKAKSNEQAAYKEARKWASAGKFSTVERLRKLAKRKRDS